ncbi:ATP-binding protein [Parasphingorhabdus flavimaris]|uniref:ATP-binding protein n=1 Tax=Parasphingorhabdus flavimaris TaxID=266812 RepID=A0ABX2MZD5_9SPHN|nr:ATP-binding protein [Parasphingorhabdus flavimaris]NVD26779.1 ATP-binding protein [Parasphingorhabdus flavimaris]
MTDQLTLRYDPMTIKHLGVSLYSQLPSVLSELISNAYDADADSIYIDLIEKNSGKEIYVRDDGHGMSFDEINEKYLMVGRNRRNEGSSGITPKKKRKVIGKKGLGKLSVFGVCTEIVVKTVKNGLENQFSMDLHEIEKLKGEYHPSISSLNKKTDAKDGTELWLKKVKRKSPFNLESIVTSLSKKFTIFDELETSISLNGKDSVILTNEMKFSDLDVKYEWDFPSKEFGTDYEHWGKIRGKILTPDTPLKDTSMKGIYLVSRGKNVNEAEFYGARDNDLVHNYMTGYLCIDFIDEFPEDIISTDRHSLIWEDDHAAELKEYLQAVVRKIGTEWRKKRNAEKEKSVSEHGGKSIGKWKDDLVPYERDLASKIIDPVLDDPSIDIDKSVRLIHGVMDQFDNQSFKEYASQLADTVTATELPKIIDLMNQWKVTELREISALATARIEVITKFEELLEGDTKEMPTLHNFLKKFSWLLDPRVLEFQDEVTYSKLLKETYPEDELDEKDKRIDFLCSNVLGGILYVIEIKRSQYVIDKKSLEQAYEYGVFLKDKYASESGFSNVVCYVVGGKKSGEGVFRAKEKTYMRSGEVFVKTYRELLEQSKIFHREFIEAHSAFKAS